MSKFGCLLFCLFAIIPVVMAQQPIDYREYDRLTRTYINAEGRVNYAGLKRELVALKSFTDQLGAISPDSHPQLFKDEKDKLRYFATAYNAWVLYLVTSNYPKRDLLWGVLGFKDQQIRLGGQMSTLETLEHKILRPRFKDPRVHFYINCAAKDCPPLPQGAMPQGQTDAELDKAARRFINNTKYVQYDAARKRLDISAIFKWFQQDFTGYLKTQHGQARPHIAQFLLLYLNDGVTKTALAAVPVNELSVSYKSYDKALNEQ
ncbi:MAG: DUF547 domain-containing protein [Acidobacteria bacterium]|nr:DUF547 domain-containing protein [Acidobacteriota bacterium]